ncbi:MAG: hypothetical protein IT440_12930 [Phycisphaeraceae bacterium]|nr:hypothetical protein [Phycisphaeraceae bacterium]
MIRQLRVTCVPAALLILAATAVVSPAMEGWRRQQIVADRHGQPAPALAKLRQYDAVATRLIASNVHEIGLIPEAAASADPTRSEARRVLAQLALAPVLLSIRRPHAITLMQWPAGLPMPAAFGDRPSIEWISPHEALVRSPDDASSAR